MSWLLASAAPALADAPQRQKIAVADLVAAHGVDPGLQKVINELLLAEVAKNPGFEAIGSSDISSMLGFERQKALLGCTEDTACLSEIGNALGAPYFLAGQLGKVGTRYRVDLKVLNTRTAKVERREGDFAEGEDSLAALVQRLVPRLLAFGESAPQAAVETAQGPSRVLPLTVLAGGAVLAGVGVAFGLAAQSTASGLQQQRQTLGPSSAAYAQVYDSQIGGLHAQEDLADVAYLLSAVALGAGAWLWLRTPSTVAVAPVRGGAALAVGGSF